MYIQMFNTFPDDLDEVEERIHECQAQADLCMGIDEEVHTYIATQCSVSALGGCYTVRNQSVA